MQFVNRCYKYVRLHHHMYRLAYNQQRTMMIRGWKELILVEIPIVVVVNISIIFFLTLWTSPYFISSFAKHL